MVNEIIADVGTEEMRIALLEDKELVEVYIEKSYCERLVGNIYRGKVISVLQGMQAAFVDIGCDKNAFLYVDDAISNKEIYEDDYQEFGKSKEPKINEILKPGQEITVQVVKESIGTKGPRVSTGLTLPGRYMVLLPNEDYICISRRIGNEKERNRLRKIVEKLKPEGMGLIIRTVSEGKSQEDFVNDINFLTGLWNSISNKQRKGRVPRCLYKDLNLVQRTVRDLFTADINKFVINDKKEYKKVQKFVDMISPALKSRVEFYGEKRDIFEYYKIESKISRALMRKVWLKCGGYLVIDRTEALTVIDVNTGKFVGRYNLEDTVVKTNIEATEEIAKQIRLRDIGGIIIIDFIDMNDHSNQQMVLNKLKEALKKDRTRTTVVGMTGLGLIEMTRKKVRHELSSIMNIDCPNCGGTGKILSPESNGAKSEKGIIRKLNRGMKLK